MKRPLAIGLAVGLVVFASTGVAFAQGSPVDSNASCVATITSFEATELPPGSVGDETSGLATSGPGFGSAVVGGLARTHAGSLEACAVLAP